MSTLPSFLPPRVAYYEIAHLTDGPLTATKLNVVTGTTIAATYP